MIVCYLRSSAMGTLDHCENQYFIEYQLGLPNKSGRKATMGTIYHRVMEILAEKKLAQQNNKRKVKTEGLPDLKLSECDDLEYITRLSFDYYSQQQPELDLKEKDYKEILGWVYKGLAYNKGELDPRNQKIIQPELFFDIEIKQPWAKYRYEIGDQTIEGYLSIKGTVDLVFDDNGIIHILDFKTGMRKCFIHGHEKTYKKLQRDPQLLFYFYALKQIYPDQDFYISIFFVNDGGLFTMSFDDEDYEVAESMIKQKFQYILNNDAPSMFDRKNTHWKCKYCCAYSQPSQEDPNKTICQYINSQVKRRGTDEVMLEMGNFDKLTTYGSGGGKVEQTNE